MTSKRQLGILTAVCNLPTAPYCEQYVAEWLLAWAKGHAGQIGVRRDKAGNVYLEYRRGRGRKRPLVVEAHMDHPGFVVMGQRRDGVIEAHFRGGVRPSHFKGARVQFCVPGAEGDGRWVGAEVLSAKTVRNQRHLEVRLKLSPSAVRKRERIPVGTLGMWRLPEAQVKGDVFAARVCDDLAGVAGIVCLLEELMERKVEGHVIGLCTRAEEVGFAGVLAVCERGWIPRGSAVVGLETSKGSPAGSAGGSQGAGPIIRVGDRTGIFSPGLTHFVAQAAGGIADDDSTFRYQRKLMDGGMCSTTAFAAWGFDAAGICLSLGNYHNMRVKGDVGYAAATASFPARAGMGIAAETIDVRDFAGMVRLLAEVARRMELYRPGWGFVRERLAKMHREEQKRMLYGGLGFGTRGSGFGVRRRGVQKVTVSAGK